MDDNRRTGSRLVTVLALVLLFPFAGLHEAGAADAARGELLYNTHCIACHTTKMHWRDQRLATDWNSLNVQVRRWQSAIQLDWDDDDIASTASYLNRLYYRFSEQTKQKVLLGR